MIESYFRPSISSATRMYQIHIIVVSLIQMLFSCSSGNNVEKNNLAYTDFDFATMKPVLPKIGPTDYPLVRTQTDNGELMVTFEYDNSLKKEIKLKVEGDTIWRGQQTVSEDKIYYFEDIYYHNKIYTLEYTMSNAGKKEMTTLTIADPILENFMVYCFNKKVIIDKMIKYPWFIDTEDAYKLEKHNWKVLSDGNTIRIFNKIEFDKKSRDMDGMISESCWTINGHVYNFFNFFPWKYDATNCR